MPRPSLIASIALLVSALAANSGNTKPVVISVDSNENIFLDNTPLSDPTQLAQIRGASAYLRADRDARFEGMCHVFEDLPNSGLGLILLGQPKGMGKGVPVGVSRAIEQAGTVSVTTKLVDSSWTAEHTATIFNIDFDGSITSNLTPNKGSLTAITAEQMLAELSVKKPHSHIYISGNRLSKVDSIETIAASAKRSGFDVTIVCRTN